MEACTSAQPLTTDEAATLPTPASTAINAVQSWALANAADSYAGIARDGSNFTLHYLPSGTTAAELVARARAATIVAVPASQTLADMQDTVTAIAANPAPLAPFDIYPDVATNMVIVRAPTVDATNLAQFYRTWTATKVLVKFDDKSSFTNGTSPAATAVPDLNQPKTSTRYNDRNPWYGGDKILQTYHEYGQKVVESCTSGFGSYGPGLYGPNSRYGTTAGHCNDGLSDNLICQGATCGASYGTAHDSLYYSGSPGDEASFANNAYPGVYTDSVSKPIETQLVRAYSLRPGIADGLCTDGSTSKERCGAFLEDDGTHCITYFPDNVTVCGIELIRGATTLAQGGDSGGPIYSYSGAGLLAQGIISGEETGTSGRVAVLVPIGLISAGLNVLPVTLGNYAQTCC